MKYLPSSIEITILCRLIRSHRSPLVRKTAAKYIYIVCEKLGTSKILSGTRDITERVLQVAAAFAGDGPPEIRYVERHLIERKGSILV